MPIPDPVTTGLVVAGTLQTAKQAQDFLSAALGHPGESVGTILGNIIRRRRDNAEAIVSDAHLTLLNLGLNAAEIPLNTLQPALEAASLQEDPTTQKRWSNMLANAADPRKLNLVETSFPRTLQELGPREVKFLDALYENKDRTAYSNAYSRNDLLRIYARAGLAQYPKLDQMTQGEYQRNRELIDKENNAYQVMLGLLIKHRLIEQYSQPKPITVDLNRVPASARSTGAIKFDIEMVEHFVFTLLGRSFVAACRPPGSSERGR